MKTKFYLHSAIIFCLAAGAAAQSGGQFTIEKSVIAGGGQSSTGGQFSVGSTNGQTVAGQRAANTLISLHAGFWNPDQFVPTAAQATVGGRITIISGGGVRNVRVTMTDAGGESRTALSSTFGYFRFTDVPAGETYVITVTSKRYSFGESSQIRTIVEDTDDINFVADGEL